MSSTLKGIRPAAALALVALLVLPALAQAQQDGTRVQRGARVRVTTFDGGPRTGEFERWDGSSLLIYEQDEPRTFAFDDIDILELSQGRSASTVGVVIGGVVGAAVGGALGCAANRDSYGVYCGGQSDTKVFVGAALGAAAGAALGALLIRVERWVPIPLLSLDPVR